MTDTKRVRAFLAEVIAKNRAKIVESQKEKKIPADYSLGFINALIFVQHQFDGGQGMPEFYNRETSIGTLPIPVALRTSEEIRETFQTPEQHEANVMLCFLESSIVTQARGLAVTLERMRAHGAATALDVPEALAREFSLGLAAVRNAVVELNTFMGDDNDGIKQEDVKIQQSTDTGKSG
jgi:hypothetical protein